MQFLQLGIATKIAIGPFVTPTTDGISLTPVTTVTASDLDEWALIKHGASDRTALDTDDTLEAVASLDGYYTVTLPATDLDTAGLLTIVAQDDSAFLPVRKDFMVLAANLYAGIVTATDNLQVHAVEYDVAANNLVASDIQAELVTYDAIKGTEGAWASDIVALSDPTAATIADAVWNELSTDHVGAGSFGLNLDAQVSTRSSHADPTIPTVAAIADGVWNEATTDHVSAGSFGLNLDSQISDALMLAETPETWASRFNPNEPAAT